MTGWDLEKDVDAPSYAVAEPVNAAVDIDTIVLTCEQGQRRSGLQLRLYPMVGRPLASRAVGDSRSARSNWRSMACAMTCSCSLPTASSWWPDSADGAVPLLSETLLDVIQAGRRLELRLSSADSLTIVDLQAGRGGAAVAAVRRCCWKGRSADCRNGRRSLLDRFPRAAHQAAGQGTGRFALPVDDGAGDDGRVEAVRPLHQALAAGRQVVDDLGPAQAQPVVVDDVDVGLQPDPQHAAIVQADRARHCPRSGA